MNFICSKNEINANHIFKPIHEQRRISANGVSIGIYTYMKKKPSTLRMEHVDIRPYGIKMK